jgi:hypothetical protein
VKPPFLLPAFLNTRISDDGAKGTLCLAFGLSGAVDAVAQWAVGDRTLISLIRTLSADWALIAGGFGLVTLSAKIDRPKAGATARDETVAAIADKALRR